MWLIIWYDCLVTWNMKASRCVYWLTVCIVWWLSSQHHHQLITVAWAAAAAAALVCHWTRLALWRPRRRSLLAIYQGMLLMLPLNGQFCMIWSPYINSSHVLKESLVASRRVIGHYCSFSSEKSDLACGNDWAVAWDITWRHKTCIHMYVLSLTVSFVMSVG